ncbi:MAG: hypothetical protein IJ220_06550 [Clostridia bacterium]|nr:hypothetical protein [Clostridia bacterium]
MWLKLIGSVIALVGVSLVFDGRHVAKKYFNYGEENIATTGVKSLGFLVAIVGAILMML